MAWGAGRAIDMPDWLPPAVGSLIALTGLCISGLSLREVLRSTRVAFSVHIFQMSAGLCGFTFACLLQILIAVQVGSPATYAQFSGPSGVSISPEAFAVYTLAGALPVMAIAGLFAWVYARGITDCRPNRVSERQPDEVDGIGRLLEERRRPL